MIKYFYNCMENVFLPIFKTLIRISQIMTRLLLILSAYFQIGFVYSQDIDTSSGNWLIIEESFDNIDSIFSRFEGNVIYLTFWASWCGPCKTEMPYANILYNELSDFPVVFLYLAVNDKMENWKKAISKLRIAGVHARLSNALYSEAKSLFGITAIPHYAIIGTDGNLSYISALPPSYPTTKTDLLQELE